VAKTYLQFPQNAAANSATLKGAELSPPHSFAAGSASSPVVKADQVYFELSNLCNFKCDFCPLPGSKRAGQHMELSLFQKGVDEIAEAKIAPGIGFHILGEPLLSPILVPALKHATSRGLRADITTNGSLLLRNVEKLIEANPTKLAISVQSSSEKDHKSRGTSIGFRAYYDGIIEAVRRIKQSSCTTELRLSLMNTYTRKFFSLDRQPGINQTGAEYAERFATTIHDVYSAIGRRTSLDQIRAALRKINLNESKTVWIADKIAMQVVLFGDWGNAFTTQEIYPAKVGYCGYALNRVGVLSNGDVTLCCVDYDGGTTLGNLKTESLVSILTSEKARAVRDGFRRFRVVHPYCQKCLGGRNRRMALLKGLLGIYLFKLRRHPLQPKSTQLVL